MKRDLPSWLACSVSVSCLAGLALGGLVACSSSSDAGTPPTDAGTKTDASVTDAAGGEDANPGADADTDANEGGSIRGTTYLRLINVGPDAPALDFCVAREGNGSFTGPMLAQAAAGGDAAAVGVAYGAASAYVPLVSDSYDVRLVAAGSTDCTLSVGPFASSLSTLQPDARTSIVVEGNVDPDADLSFGLRPYDDDTTAPTSGIALRFINTASNVGLVDFGSGDLATTSFTPFFEDVAPGDEGTTAGADAGTLDTHKYLPLPAFASQKVSAHVSDQPTDTVVASGLTIADGKNATLLLIGGVAGDSAHPSAFVLCEDGEQAATPACSILP
jgi:hypothetical protein